jgi:tetratricopeptide (TPR) repeat protein
LGVVPFNHGRYGEAKARFAEGLALARELGSAQATYTSLYDVALAAQAQGEYAEAHTLYTEGLVLCAECDDVLYVAYYLEGLAGVAGSVGVPHCAARLFAASHSLLERTGVPLYARATSTAFLKACLDHARTQLTAAAWQEAWAEGWALTQEQAIRYALDPTNTVPQWKSRS